MFPFEQRLPVYLHYPAYAFSANPAGSNPEILIPAQLRPVFSAHFQLLVHPFLPANPVVHPAVSAEKHHLHVFNPQHHKPFNRLLRRLRRPHLPAKSADVGEPNGRDGGHRPPIDPPRQPQCVFGSGQHASRWRNRLLQFRVYT